MVTSVIETRFVCALCIKSHATEKMAISCEKKCNKLVKEMEDRFWLKRKITEIRKTAKTMDELISGYKEALKTEYGADFVFRVYYVTQFSVGISICHYPKKSKKNSFTLLAREIDVDALISHMGFVPMNRQSSVHVSHFYGCEYTLENFPRIKKHFLEEYLPTIDSAKENLLTLAKNLNQECIRDETYSEMESHINAWQKKIAKMQSVKENIRRKYIDTFSLKYESEISNLPKNPFTGQVDITKEEFLKYV